MNKIQNTTKAVKTHVTKHKTAYLVGGGVVVGAAAGFAAAYYLSSNVTGDISLTAEVNEGLMVGVNNGTINQLIARGHRGYEILCNETGESWASLRRAAEVADVSVDRMRKHVNGLAADIDGKTYTNVGEYMG